MENKHLIEILNALVETSRDGDKGFTACASESEKPALKAYFTICATRCRESVAALDTAIRAAGGTTETTGTVAEGAHRAWLNLRTALTSHNDLPVLEECERAEDHALKAYAAALDKDLPAPVRTLVLAQFEGVKENHGRVKTMRDDERQLVAG